MLPFGKEGTYAAVSFHRTESRLKVSRLIIGMVLRIMVRGRGLLHPYLNLRQQVQYRID